MSIIKISDQLKQYRTLNNYTQQQIADYLQIAVSAYNHYESGARVPGPDKLAALARLYKLEDQILGVYCKEVSSSPQLHTFNMTDIIDNLPSQVKNKYTLQSNKKNKKIFAYDTQFQALVRFFSDFSEDKQQLFSELSGSKNGNEGKLYEILVYEWLGKQGIPFDFQPFIKSSDCLKKHDYNADGEIEGCIFDVKMYGITLPNIKRLQDKLNTSCKITHPEYYITVSGNFDIPNENLEYLLSHIPDTLNELFSDDKKIFTDYLYHLSDFQIDIRANSISKKRIITSVSEFNPYKWARDNQFYFFHDSSQFCVNRPYIIICPYDAKLAPHLTIGNPDSMNCAFRSLCRRMFMGMPDNEYTSSLDDKSVPMVSLKAASKCISAVIFQDVSFAGKNNGENNDTWIFLNPNALNKMPRYAADMFRFHMSAVLEDFSYDLY